MALVVGNKQIQSIVPQYDDMGVLTAILVRANRSIVDDSTNPPTIKYGLPTSRGVNILPLLTSVQQTAARGFIARLAQLLTTAAEFEE